MFTDFNGLNIEHGHPIALLIFTLCWLGVFLRKRIFALLYFSLIVVELMMKLFFGNYLYGEVFGKVFFPADILFLFVILFLYKQIFGERSTQQRNSNT
jgi:energy-coupling factor transporter transmembrane protein EcfT